MTRNAFLPLLLLAFCWKVTESCDPNPCLNDGKCIGDAGGTYTCLCAFPYYGTHCESASCTPNPCMNGGTCVDTDTFECICPPDYTGTICESVIPCYPGCQNGGVCIGDPPACECTPEYAGSNCQFPINCDPECKNGGRCTIFGCLCPPGYGGEDCDLMIPCYPGCQNGGVCTGDPPACECTPEYAGSNCQFPINCDPECKNGGTCTIFGCLCPPGYGGEDCDLSDVPSCGYDCSVRNPCTGDNLGVYRYPYVHDCHRYVECAPQYQPECHVRPCPLNLVWNPYLMTCSYPPDGEACYEFPCQPKAGSAAEKDEKTQN